jgi:hypothetical protein
MDTALKLNQALFGYSDGHRLLSASLQFAPREMERLLILSDIAPNAATAGAEGYWTGSPLPDSGRYAIIRTWPATEMSRPGCVWSHVLIVDHESIERVWDVTSLSRFFIRPNLQEGFEQYKYLVTSNLEIDPTTNLSRKDTESVLQSVYLERQGEDDHLSQVLLGAALCAIWSQQWPALRNSFRFRTLQRTSPSRKNILQFDFTLDNLERKKLKEDPQSGIWMRTAADDLITPKQPTVFRQYLREHGSLLPPTTASFRILGLAFMLRYANNGSIRAVEELFNLVEELYPQSHSAEAFKRQIVTFDRAYVEALGLESAVQTMQFLLTASGYSAFKLQSIQQENIDFLWEHAPTKMFSLIRTAATSREDFPEEFLAAVAQHSSTRYLVSAADEPDVFLALAARNSKLLSSATVNLFSEQTIYGLINALSAGNPLVRPFCEALSSNPSQSVAETIFRKHPSEAVRQTAILLSRAFHAEPANPIWLQLASVAAPATLDQGILESFTTTAELAAYAEMLSYLTAEVKINGPVEWAKSLSRVIDDVAGLPRNTFQAFLVALALSAPQPGAEKLLQFGFEPLHQLLWDSSLNHQASVILEAALPQPRWFWQNWDVCLRLRRGVTRAFVDGHLPIRKFLSLTENPSLLGMLLEALEEGRSEDRAFRVEVLRLANHAR